MRPVLQYAIVATAGIAIGAVGGALFSWRYAITTWVPVTDLFVVVQASAWTTASRSNGDPAAYEDALRAYLRVLDTAMQRDSTNENRAIYLRDKALTLVRLSDVVQKRGAREEANSLRHQAEALCPAYGRNDCNAASLSELVKKLDRM